MKRLVMGAVFALIAGMGQAAPVQWTEASGGNGHYYELVSGDFTWDEANTAAQGSVFNGMQGYLATATSALENTFIFNLLNVTTPIAWLGGSDADSEGLWTWVDGPDKGTAFTFLGFPTGAFQNWAPNEPNDAGGNEDYLHIGFFGDQWNDIPGTLDYAYVVEYSADFLAPAAVPLPAGVVLLGSGLGIMALRRRRRV